MVNQRHFKSLRAFFEEVVVEAFHVQKDGVAVIFPGLGTLQHLTNAFQHVTFTIAAP